MILQKDFYLLKSTGMALALLVDDLAEVTIEEHFSKFISLYLP
jgi:hypothetical protein